jgi:hypothetical protein
VIIANCKQVNGGGVQKNVRPKIACLLKQSECVRAYFLYDW